MTPRERAVPPPVSPPAVRRAHWLRAGREGRGAGTHHVGCARNASAELRRLPRGGAKRGGGGGLRARSEGISERASDGGWAAVQPEGAAC